jgi:SAM-dependent methyltransferase
MTSLQRLRDLYRRQSKHAQYQVLPEALSQLLNASEKPTRPRYEKERLNYICSRIGFAGKRVLDIGGNTGFFSIEALTCGASYVEYVEGNPIHAEFVALAADVLGVGNRIQIVNEYFHFDAPISARYYDVTLLLNVLHHMGDDFGDQRITCTQAKETIPIILNSIADISRKAVFQLGFNWRGDRTKPIFDNGTKTDQISFIQERTRDSWDLQSIGIAELTDGGLVYRDMHEGNIQRSDRLGEFLNRPLFILQSRVVGSG